MPADGDINREQYAKVSAARLCGHVRCWLTSSGMDPRCTRGAAAQFSRRLFLTPVSFACYVHGSGPHTFGYFGPLCSPCTLAYLLPNFQGRMVASPGVECSAGSSDVLTSTSGLFGVGVWPPWASLSQGAASHILAAREEVVEIHCPEETAPLLTRSRAGHSRLAMLAIALFALRQLEFCLARTITSPTMVRRIFMPRADSIAHHPWRQDTFPLGTRRRLRLLRE